MANEDVSKPSDFVERSPQVSTAISSSFYNSMRKSSCDSSSCLVTSVLPAGLALIPSCASSIKSEKLPDSTLHYTKPSANLAGSNNNARNTLMKKDLQHTPPTMALISQSPKDEPLQSISEPAVISSWDEQNQTHQDQVLVLPTTTQPPLSSYYSHNDYCEQASALRDKTLQVLRATLDSCIFDISPCIRPEDLPAFTRDAKQGNLIPRRVMEDLTMMHPSVSLESRCRYLMLYVGKAIKEGEQSGQNYLFNSLCNILYRYLSYEQLNFCIESACRASGLTNLIQTLTTQTEVAAFYPEKHLGRVFDKLKSYSHLWDNIGIALHFTRNNLEQIKAECASFSNSNIYKCLHSLLDAWMNRKYEHVKPATLARLQEALRNEIVGLGRVANEIGDVFKNMIIPQSYPKDYESFNPVVCTNSDDIVIEESENETVVLLEVKLCGHNPHSVDYKWTKDGKDLKNLDSEVLKSNKPKNVKHIDSVLGNSILSIRIADLCAEGKYKCICTLGNDVIESDVILISVKTQLLKYRAQLVTQYKTERQLKLEENSWPPVHLDKFINLAVVGGEGVRLSDNCYQQTIQGNADDEFSSKASIDYQEAFKDIEYGDRVLVVGRPGSGKTTLVHAISKDWARGSILEKYKALFLVCLRGFDNNLHIKLDDIVNCYFDVEAVAEICVHIRKNKGLGTCFILDGLDEYQPEKNNFIFDLIRLRALPRATVIVASRPAAVATFVEYSRRHIEVLGFFKEQIKDYIDCYNFYSDLQRSDLKTYLANHPNIHHMCYLPIQTAMICFLFCECEDALPNTETGIYSEFTKQTLLRALHRNKGSRCILQSLEDLQGKEKSILLDICKLAYEMTILSRQVIKLEKAEMFLNTRKIDESLGLITVDEKATICGFQHLYSFCHLTFLEFLAAYHIFRLEIHDQLAIIKSYGPMKHMYMVFKFYCGLAQFEEKDIRFKTLVEVAKFNTLHTVQCCFESQQSDTCDLVAEKNIIYIGRQFRTPSDYTCLGYVVINASNNPVRIIECSKIELSSECIEAYINATKNAEDAHKPVAMWVCLEESEGDRKLNMIEMCPSLLKQRFYEREMSLYYPVCFNLEASRSNKDYSSLLYSTHCHEVSSHINSACQKSEMLAISYALKCDINCCHDPYGEYDDDDDDICICTDLIIFSCNLNNSGAALLAEGLKYNSRVQVLKLVANDIGDEGALAIAGSIEGCSSLRYLDLSLNKIGDKGAIFLVNSMRSNCSLLLFGNHVSDTLIEQLQSKNIKELFYTLNITDNIRDKGLARVNFLMRELSLSHFTLETQQALYMDSCGNDVDGIREVANILSKFTCLYSLSLVKINIGAEGVKLLINSLLWEHIQILNLSHNSLGPKGMIHLCQALQEISHPMLTLNLGHNDIGVEGALAVAGSLQGGELLCELDLSYNDIQDTGTEDICEFLKDGDKLHVFNLASNCIRVLGCFSIALLLEQHAKSLITLDLSRNFLHDIGVVRLARSLRYCTGLQELYLDENHIGDIGVEAVAEVLKDTDLMKLSLVDNFINNEGAKALGCGLQSCSKLAILSLSNNVIGDLGASSLGEGLSHCSRLHKLELNDNFISGSGAISLAKGVGHCHELNVLELGYNYIVESNLKPLAMALKDCKELKSLHVPSKLLEVYKNPVNEWVYFRECLQNCSLYGTVEEMIIDRDF